MHRRTFATVLVGPNALAREGLGRILRAASFRIAASVPCISDASLNTLPRDQILLLVIDAGNALPEAIEQVELFKEHFPDGRVAVLASDYELTGVISAFQAGANSYFVHVTDAASFVKSLELVMMGETLLPPEILPLILDHEDPGDDDALVPDAEIASGIVLKAKDGYVPQLSARENCILRCLTEGHSNKAIARKFNIAEATVKVHIKAILRKIRVHNRTQAAMWAVNNGSPTAALQDIAVRQIESAVEPTGNASSSNVAPRGHAMLQTIPGRKRY
jgi:two-component system nitrate/nitrite response regulator NarL